VKNLERLSKKQSNNQATDQSGTVDFSCQSPGVNVSPQMFSGLQIDSAVSRLVWIDVHNVSYSPFLCRNDMNPDSHAYAQCDRSQNQSTMEVDDECFAFTRQGFAHTKRLDPNFQTNAGAPSGLASNWLGGHTHPPLLDL